MYRPILAAAVCVVAIIIAAVPLASRPDGVARTAEVVAAAGPTPPWPTDPNPERIALSFSAPPELHVPVTLTLTITPSARLLEVAVVRVQIPSDMLVLSTEPTGWTSSHGWLSRTEAPMLVGHGYSYEFLVESTSIFDGWIVARVETGAAGSQ
jgi:hypothetical protein